jgi:gamma-glutamyltranspeptidase/glutathione hydrolase
MGGMTARLDTSGIKGWIGLALLLGGVGAGGVSAQPTPVQMCDETTPTPAWCKAVRGDRSEGWIPQTRSEVMARNGMVSTVQPLAAQAGLSMLMKGGNAIDAAVAAAAALNVTYPANVGIAGDLFVIVYIAKENKIYQLNASGIAPSGATLEHMNALGYKWNPANFGPGSGMPSGGITTVTVPGSLWGWQEVLDRFGTMSFKDVLQPAIDLADNGFPITEEISDGWNLKKALGPVASSAAGCCTQPDPDTVATYFSQGNHYNAGTIFRNPDLAHTFRLIADQGRDVFYKGEIAQAIVKKSNAVGGTMTLADLANYKGEWVTPASTTYHGQYGIYTTYAPSQAWGIVEEMNVLEQCVPQWYPGQTLESLGPASPLFWHALIETKKIVYRDVYGYNADPDVVKVPVATLTSKPHAADLCSQVNPNQASTPTPLTQTDIDRGDTIYLTTADRWGNMVSWINSNFAGWGSGLTVPGYGFILHNRGGLFTLNPDSPNVIAPHKRPYNTLSAVFVTKNGVPLFTTGQHGGDQQGMGNMQVLVNILDLHANMQAAGDMARFTHSQVTNKLQLETNLFELVGAQLSAMGHNVSPSDGGIAGGYEGIMFVPDPNAPQASSGPGRACQGPAAAFNPNCPAQPIKGFYRAGSNFREDGHAVGF